MKFALFGNTYQTKKSAHAKQLLALLAKKGAQVTINKEFHQFLSEQLQLDLTNITFFEGDKFEADIVISLGGDGTFLKAASKVGQREIPILGINTGRLGFLADTSPNEIEQSLEDIYNGNYKIASRSVLKLLCNGQVLKGNPYALNEIAILKRDSSSMIAIHASIDGSYLNTYQADGLIISTPTGSTAYSLSVGGPIMVPQSKTISITPVAPHSLNVRPIVINDEWEVTLDVESRSHNFLIAIDGRSETCKQGSKLTIQKANYVVKVVQRCNHTFFQTLRDKMMWGMDGRR
ncbi:MAG: NAD kinase [Phocaeicola sp.]